MRIDVADAGDGRPPLQYRIVSRAECQLCHNPWVEKKTTGFGFQSASPLAVDLAQWSVADAAERQLETLHREGWLSEAWLAQVDQHVALVDPYDPSRSVAERARSYLHVNCVHCHQLHAGGSATINLAYDSSLSEMGLIDVRPAQGAFEIPDARLVKPADPYSSVLYYRLLKSGAGRMPRMGGATVDERGAAPIGRWIEGLGSPSPDTVARQRQWTNTLERLQRCAANERPPMISEWLQDTRRAVALADSIRQGVFDDETRQQVLAASVASPKSSVRELFESLLPPSQRPHRLGDVVDVVELLQLDGDAERGRKLFQQDGAALCKSCHRFGREGRDVGPELTHIGAKYSKQQLLVHLLEPSRWIEPKFRTYLLETTDGRVFTGVLTGRSEDEVRLRDGQGKEHRIAAGNIERLVTQPKSLMPELLLRDMTPQQAADLLHFLSNSK